MDDIFVTDTNKKSYFYLQKLLKRFTKIFKKLCVLIVTDNEKTLIMKKLPVTLFSFHYTARKDSNDIFNFQNS